MFRSNYKRPMTTKFQEDSSDDEWEIPFYGRSQTPIDNLARNTMNLGVESSDLKNFRSSDG